MKLARLYIFADKYDLLHMKIIVTQKIARSQMLLPLMTGLLLRTSSMRLRPVLTLYTPSSYVL